MQQRDFVPITFWVVVIIFSLLLCGVFAIGARAEAAALVISNVHVVTTETTATITWTTNLPADSEVSYLLFLSNTNVVQSALVMDHAVTLTALAPNEKYYYTIRSVAQDGQSAFRDYSSFAVQPSIDSSSSSSNMVITTSTTASSTTTTIGTAGSTTGVSARPENTSSTPSLDSSVGSNIFTRPLYMGLRDIQVEAVQSLLIKKGYLSIANPTGFFGNLTLVAIRKFQCDQGIVCSRDGGWGMVGPKTRGVLNGLSGGTH